jgi:hypothetical protein
LTAPPSALERAYQLARSGNCRGLSDIRAALKSEGYVRYDSLLDGLGLRRQLKQLCASARTQALSD